MLAVEEPAAMKQRRQDRVRNATMSDVARLAGVSQQTVSRVINNHPNVHGATRRKVQNAIEQLHYRPNIAARAMVNGRTRTLGLITTGSADYGPTSTVLGLMSAARDAGYGVSVTTAVDTNPQSIGAAVDQVIGQHVEAIVVVASRRSILDGLAGLDDGMPIVVIESSGRSNRFSMAIDQYAGARLATEHLIALGHREIAHLMGPDDASDATERVRGWRDAMAEGGLVARRPVGGDWTPQSGYAAAARLMATGVPYTAVFVANDQMALGCIHALRIAGRSVPGDLSVIGFDDIPEAAYFTPPLTTVRQDFTQLGIDVLESVLQIVDGRPVEHPTLRLPELVVRESTRHV